MRIRLIVSLLFSILAAGFVGPLTTQAARTGGAAAWGIVAVPDQNPATTAKGYFVYPLQPDARANGQILVQNPGTTPVTIDLTAVTAQTAQNGGSAFATESGAIGGIAGWIALSEPQATVAAGTQRTIDFSVHVPAAIKPGQYLAGIAASETPTASAAQAGTTPKLGASITMHKRYIIAVETDVPGAWVAAMSIAKVAVEDHPSGTGLGIQMRNDGDVFLTPSGAITVTNAAGARILTQPIPMGTFVTGTAVTYPIGWAAKPVAGTYRVAVDMAYANGKHATYNDTFTISPAVVAHAAAIAAASNPPVVAPAPVSAGLPGWILYGMGGIAVLFVLMIILLALNLRRRRPETKPA